MFFNLRTIQYFFLVAILLNSANIYAHDIERYSHKLEALAQDTSKVFDSQTTTMSSDLGADCDRFNAYNLCLAATFKHLPYTERGILSLGYRYKPDRRVGVWLGHNFKEYRSSAIGIEGKSPPIGFFIARTGQHSWGLHDFKFTVSHSPKTLFIKNSIFSDPQKFHMDSYGLAGAAKIDVNLNASTVLTLGSNIKHVGVLRNTYTDGNASKHFTFHSLSKSVTNLGLGLSFAKEISAIQTTAGLGYSVERKMSQSSKRFTAHESQGGSFVSQGSFTSTTVPKHFTPEWSAFAVKALDKQQSLGFSSSFEQHGKPLFSLWYNFSLD